MTEREHHLAHEIQPNPLRRDEFGLSELVEPPRAGFPAPQTPPTDHAPDGAPSGVRAARVERCPMAALPQSNRSGCFVRVSRAVRRSAGKAPQRGGCRMGHCAMQLHRAATRTDCTCSPEAQKRHASTTSLVEPLGARSRGARRKRQARVAMLASDPRRRGLVLIARPRRSNPCADVRERSCAGRSDCRDQTGLRCYEGRCQPLANDGDACDAMPTAAAAASASRASTAVALRSAARATWASRVS